MVADLETLTVQIEKLVYGGDGLARAEGRVVLTPFVLPDEVVRIEAVPQKRDLLCGRVLEIIAPSPERIAPPCPYFGHCGGCQYQHAPYEYQLKQKSAILREVLRRTGKIDFEDEIEVIAGEPWGYRNRVQLHIEDGKIGYFEHGSHRLCAIDRCPIASPKLNEAIAKIQAQLPKLGRFAVTLELFTNETDLQVNVLDRVPPQARAFFDTLGVSGAIEYEGFRVSKGSFFQVNRLLVGALVDAATGDASGDHALDLYAGVGLFSVALAKHFRRVTAVEASRSGFRDLEHNAPANVQAVRQSAEEFLAATRAAPDLILADPPRAGLGKQVVDELVRLRATRVHIVSCDPATLARDLAMLLKGGYRVRKLALVDLFPQTFHMEAVVHLEAA